LLFLTLSGFRSPSRPELQIISLADFGSELEQQFLDIIDIRRECIQTVEVSLNVRLAGRQVQIRL
jgi:hypothetical protein